MGAALPQADTAAVSGLATGPAMAATTEQAYENLCVAAAACDRCPGMAGRLRLLSAANGRPGARVMFVAEAPGRLGGDRTGVPLSGDRSGARFDRLLAAAGWERHDVFVTNAVLCNPRSPDGRRNRPPSSTELRSCADLLSRQIAVVGPLVVAPLGAVALAAVARCHPHHLVLRADVGRPAPWGDRWLVPLYHPGDRAQIQRREPQQADDFRARRAFVDALVGAADREARGRPRTGDPLPGP